MSTEYTTKPPVKFKDFIQKLIETKSIDIQEPRQAIFQNKHKVLHRKGSYIFVVESDDGYIEFVRFGRNNIYNIFPIVIEEFGVEILDEFGLKYPDCIS